MNINGKSIRGMFLYQDTLEFEKGDFVVAGDLIYICTPKSGEGYIKGEDPANSTNYTPYPGELGSVQDYQAFLDLKDSGYSAPDKYVSSTALYKILQSQFFGLNAQGIITKIFTTNDELASLMLSKESNNGMVLVDRSVVQSMLPEIYNEFSDNCWCIVRQSTYSYNVSSTITRTIRVQELIDPTTGAYFTRFLNYGVDFTPSAWESGIECDASLMDKFRRIKNYYIALAEDTRRATENLVSSYCIQSIFDLAISEPDYVKITNPRTIQITLVSGSKFKELIAPSGRLPITLTMSSTPTNDGSDVLATETMTIDVLQFKPEDGADSRTVSYRSGSKGWLVSVLFEFSGTDNIITITLGEQNASIVDAYVKTKYLTES